MDLIHFIVFACIVYIAIVLVRMSMKNDMRRRFASIEEGQNFSDVESVINYILKLRDQVETLLTDKKALTNSLNIANAGRENLERGYKVLLEHLKEKRKECEAQETFISQQGDSNKELVARINKCADKFDEWMQKLWEFVNDINDNMIKYDTSLSEYGYDINKTGKKYIYVTELMNKSHLLTIGELEVLKNGKINYDGGSRSLGNYSSKENWAWLNDINPNGALPMMNPRESKPIALIFDYEGFMKAANKYADLHKTSVNIINESASMVAYMSEIRDEFPNILYNKK